MRRWWCRLSYEKYVKVRTRQWQHQDKKNVIFDSLKQSHLFQTNHGEAFEIGAKLGIGCD